jgi:antagonist of KipI
MSLLVREPGLYSLVVDLGRPRSRALGVPLGGAADRAALAIGNALVGNEPQAAALEVTLFGPVLEALHPTACVIFGAPFAATRNGDQLTPGFTFQLEPGDVLRVGGTPTGARACVCVAGGFDVPEVLSSRTALEALRAGDVLPCGPSRGEGRGLGSWGELTWRAKRPTPLPPLPKGRGEQNEDVSLRSASEESLPCSSSAARRISPPPYREGGAGGGGCLRALPGPQADWFAPGFFAHEYEVLPASNRMGVRLRGPALSRRAGELASEAVAPGAVQVTNDGQPIVLGVDGQTIGGYPKVAHVIRADLDALAHLRPGSRVRFALVTATEAEAAARDRADALAALLARVRAAERAPVRG